MVSEWAWTWQWVNGIAIPVMRPVIEDDGAEGAALLGSPSLRCVKALSGAVDLGTRTSGRHWRTNQM